MLCRSCHNGYRYSFQRLPTFLLFFFTKLFFPQSETAPKLCFQYLCFVPITTTISHHKHLIKKSFQLIRSLHTERVSLHKENFRLLKEEKKRSKTFPISYDSNCRGKLKNISLKTFIEKRVSRISFPFFCPLFPLFSSLPSSAALNHGEKVFDKMQ
jgi:hypothetical protein